MPSLILLVAVSLRIYHEYCLKIIKRLSNTLNDWPSGFGKWLMDITGLAMEDMLLFCSIGLVIAIDEADEETALGAINQSFLLKESAR